VAISRARTSVGNRHRRDLRGRAALRAPLGAGADIVAAGGAQAGIDSPGAPSATCDAQIVRRGEHARQQDRQRQNPDPQRLTPAAVNELGFSLLDLLQIGTDGSSGYLQVFVGERPGPFGYCVLYESEVEDQLPTFSDGLFSIVSRHSRWHHGVEEDG
jgi:hypothetical protein